MSLIIVKPITITDAMLISSDIPETDYAAWNSGTSYSTGQRVILTSTHKVYEALRNSLNRNPVTQTEYWIEVSPTNRWKVFDTSNTTQTVAADNSSQEAINYTIKPFQYVNAVALLNITNGLSATIVVTDPTYGVVYNETYELVSLPENPDWWSWLIGGKQDAPTQLVVTDIQGLYPSASITVSLLGMPGFDLSLGAIILGPIKEFSLGVSYGARVGIQDYSRKEVNEFGDTVLVQRAFAKRATFDLMLRSREVDSFNNFLIGIRGTPCLWIGSSAYESMTIFGFYKNYDILISYPSYSDASLEIEGLT